MKYNIRKDLHGDFNVIEVNKLKPRSYFIPYPNKDEALSVDILDKRYKSSLVDVLNGIYDFKFIVNPNELENEIDTDNFFTDTIDVPSCYQYRGYGYKAYINLRYPFLYKQPNIPTTKPVTNYFSLMDGFKKAPKDEYNNIALYRRFFDINDLTKRYTISFLGVCSCFEIYVNGSFVGYSEGSHNTAEFDLTHLVKQGSNELLVVVHRWCNGTYLECQDMFRSNGIFRDVLLRKEEKEGIFDIDFITTKHDGLYDAKVMIEATGNIEVSVSLCNKTITKQLEKGTNYIEIKDLVVDEWSAEYPNVYDLVIETKHSAITTKVGFKTIEVINDLYLLNGHKIKFKGVNHHDTNPINGYTMSPKDILKDILVCKEYNVDTIRTSHYPADPLLMELATIYGIYIVDEADIETHGVMVQKVFPLLGMSKISNDIKWVSHYLDRANRHYNRDKIFKTPIVMWSIGNESGDGVCTKANYDFYKTVTTIPVHYESAVHEKRKAYDIASEMYPPVDRVKEIGEKTYKVSQFIDRPYFMCEYAHAMGVGPGNIEGYWSNIYKYDGLIGGCIWEMNDHATIIDDHYGYGGDNGEWIHDSNFCCDGIFYPDRTPSTGAFIMKHCYRPIRVTHVGDNVFEVFNTTSFTEGNNYELIFEINNKTITKVVDVKPLEKVNITLNLDKLEDISILYITTIDKRNNKVVDIDDIKLSYKVRSEVVKTKLPKEFSLVNNTPVIKVNDKVLVASEQYTLLYRANTDNDKFNMFFKTMPKWYKEKVASSKIVSQNDNEVVIESIIKAGGNTLKVVDKYEGVSEGVLVTSSIECLIGNGTLPRFAKSFKLDKSFDSVSYFGEELETYLDMKEHSIIKLNNKKVNEMTERNIKPQESGNRMDTLFATLSDSTNSFSFIAINKPFELGVKPYSDLELTTMMHTNDEINTGTYVSISAFQQGIGTGSCGPATLPIHKYSIKNKYELSFIISFK